MKANSNFAFFVVQPDKELDKNVKAYKRRRMAREAEMESDNDDDDGEVL